MRKGFSGHRRWLPAALMLFASLMFWGACSDKKPSPSSPGEGTVTGETSELFSLSDSLVTAFQSGDKAGILAFVQPEYRDICEEQLAGDQMTMTAAAGALEKRVLVFMNDKYAEYEVTVGGKKHSVTYCNSGDGHWQLMRF